jgi:hypothetical protein
MNFTEYRSKSLSALRAKLEKENIFMDAVCRMYKFSTWTVDDCCAVNWKNENPIEVCVSALYSYIKDDVIGFFEKFNRNQ